MSWKSWIQHQGISLDEFAQMIADNYPTINRSYSAPLKVAVSHCVSLGFTTSQIARAFKMKEQRINQINIAVSKQRKAKYYQEVKEQMHRELSMYITEQFEAKSELEELLQEYIIPVRYREVVLKRQIIMYYLRKDYQFTYEAIGKLFNRHHATVIHAEKLISSFIEMGDKQTLKSVENLQKVLENVKNILTQHSITN